MTTKSNSTFGPFDEHGRFTGPALVDDRIVSADWAKPELTPLAPSPWSPVAPQSAGNYWRWTGKHEDAPVFERVFLSSARDGCEYSVMRNGEPHSTVEAGGFWLPVEAPETKPDRSAKILAQQLAKLELITKIMRHGPFEGWASEIDGVVSTLRAANFLEIDKVERMSIKEIEENEELIHSAIAFLILHPGSVRAQNLASDAGFAAERLAEAAKKGAK